MPHLIFKPCVQVLQPSAYVSIRQHTSAYVSIRHLRASAPTCSIRQHTSAYVSIRQHTSAYVTCVQVLQPSAYVSIRQHTSAYVTCVQVLQPSAYVSIRQHTSAYVSIRQHTSAYVSIRHLRSSAPALSLCSLPPSPAAVAAPVPRSLPAPAYVSIRQHTSAYVSIRQHTSACCSCARSALAARTEQRLESVSICTFVLVKQKSKKFGTSARTSASRIASLCKSVFALLY